MNISTKSRYGLKAVVYLGLKYSLENVSIKEISDKEQISKRYLEQIFSQLKKGGIVKSTKGTKGGYSLSKKPSEISVGDVLRLLEGNLEVVENDENTGSRVEDIDFTIMKNVWEKMNTAIKSVADEMTIEDLINDYNRNNQVMFYI